jgi:hypothetical protein
MTLENLWTKIIFHCMADVVSKLHCLHDRILFKSAVYNITKTVFIFNSTQISGVRVILLTPTGCTYRCAATGATASG